MKKKVLVCLAKWVNVCVGVSVSVCGVGLCLTLFISPPLAYWNVDDFIFAHKIKPNRIYTFIYHGY